MTMGTLATRFTGTVIILPTSALVDTPRFAIPHERLVTLDQGFEVVTAEPATDQRHHPSRRLPRLSRDFAHV
jgi:hypothetical protein